MDFLDSIMENEIWKNQEKNFGKTAKLKEILNLLAKSKTYDNFFN